MDQRNPLERAAHRLNERPIIAALYDVRSLAIHMLAAPIDDPRAALSRIQTLAVQIDVIADDAFAAARRAGQ